MSASERDVKNRISSVRNIEKITRAMEMVSAARLRRAEQRIEALRPYAGAIRRMTRQAAQAAGAEASRLPLLQVHDTQDNVRLMLVTADRGLAGGFNSQIMRAGLGAGTEHAREGRTISYSASGRRGVSSLRFRGHEPDGEYVGFTDRPSYANAREIAHNLMASYVDGDVDRVEVFYNGYISPLVQEVRREVLLPLSEATVMEGGEHDVDTEADREDDDHPSTALVEYEPDASVILRRLIPDYVEVSIFRALLESTASEHGARMTAMRSASDNARDVISDLTLEMNRARQAEITQEIMEVVAGAEALA